MLSPRLSLVISLLFTQFFSASSYAEHPGSFRQAKKQAVKIYAGHQSSFYCGCDYQQKRVDARGCGYQPRKQAKRGKRIEWEHLVPAWELGHQRQCWQQGGRKHCKKRDKGFVRMTSDLHNLVPAVGELNGDRGNFRFAQIEGEPRRYGRCDFEVDFKSKRAEPAPEQRGDIARTYFYMRDRYGLRLSKQKTQLFNAWAKSDPVDDWERERNRRITRLQGNSNCYVSGDCRIQPDRSVAGR